MVIPLVRRRSWTTPYVAALSTSAIALRLFAPRRILRGISGGRWAAFLGATASAIKLIEISIRVLRRQVPPGRVLLPAIFFIELLRISIAGASRVGLIVCAVAFELCLIVFAIVLLRRARTKDERWQLEDHYEHVFAQFFPGRLAAFASREVVLLWEGLRWAARGFRPSQVSGFGYLEQSFFALLPIALPILTITDEIVLGILLRHQALWIRLGVIGLDIWAILYVFGIYATCQARPHQITSSLVRLRQGIFGSCEFSPALLTEVSSCSEADQARKEPGIIRLTLKGSPAVKIRLSQPVTVRQMIRGERTSQTLLVSADKPDALCHALREAQACAQTANS
ncbi:MAG TPA: hypothetical protein VFA71_04030 [Terriglobales bacterium]|nr:hypothetical protein [Terriglobales bacterium]